MKILVGCEESQAVTIELRKLGHEAYSCDILPCTGGYPEWHLQMDVFGAIEKIKPEMGIFHPPCTMLTVSNTHKKRGCTKYTAEEAIILENEASDFFIRLYNSNIERIAIENPIGIMSSRFRKPDQIIRPYMFGDDASKATCLWLKNLPKIKPTNIIQPTFHTSKTGKRYDSWWFKSSLISNLKERASFRSKTFHGIAKAMALQWTS